MKKAVVTFTALSLLSLANIGFAHENPDQKTTCYFFQNNKLKSKSACVQQTGGGAGGMYSIYKVGKKTYHFETNTMNENYTTEYYETDSKTKPVVSYSRDIKTLAILTDKQAEKVKNPLYCYRTQDKKIDICTP